MENAKVKILHGEHSIKPYNIYFFTVIYILKVLWIIINYKYLKVKSFLDNKTIHVLISLKRKNNKK